MRRVSCLILVAALLLTAFAGCDLKRTRRVDPAPIEYATQPPLPENYDTAAAETDHVSGNVAYLISDEFASSRTAGMISEAFREQYSRFAIELLKQCSLQNAKDGGSKNGTLVSPLSVLTALAMTVNGAQGDTLDEMMRVLGGALNRDDLNQQLYNYYATLKSTDEARFDAANAVWMTDNSGFTVKKGFVDVVSDTFRAQLARVPFAEKATVDAINDWCREHTGGMIPKVLEYGDVDANTVMVLCNALFFDAIWAEQYTEFDVSEGKFHGTDGNTQAEFMSSVESYYISGQYETGFIKWYRGRYAFVALLPKRGMTVDKYLATLTGADLVNLIHEATSDYDVNAKLPKFTNEWSGRLREALRAMGINAAFDADAADFSALGSGINGNVYIDEVIHKTYIEMCEKGTKAAAVTAVVMPGNAAPVIRQTRDVVLDRPFVYAIVDTESWLPIFIGTVTNI